MASKQEEIREEGIHRFYIMVRDDLPLGATLDGYLQYLHENDVVILSGVKPLTTLIEPLIEEE